jgi:DNA-3-methyladenine glycosylase I
LAGYLEALSRPVFSTGMSWRVIEAKWDGIRDAFAGFDPERVAAMTDADVDRLVEDPRIIRNRKKIEATIVNAERMLELDREHGGFGSWLDSLGSFDETVPALRREFRFLGEMGAYLFLWTVGRPVPSHEEWAKTHGRVVA